MFCNECSRIILQNFLYNLRPKIPLKTCYSICSVLARCLTPRIFKKITASMYIHCTPIKRRCISYSKQIHSIQKRSQTNPPRPNTQRRLRLLLTFWHQTKRNRPQNLSPLRPLSAEYTCVHGLIIERRNSTKKEMV